MKKIQIGLIGPEEKDLPKGDLKEKFISTAKEIGKVVALNKAVLITGGCSGVAQAACQGAYESGGITVGTPGRTRGTSVPFVTVEICTPIDVGDYIFAGTLSCDSIIVFPGGAGTVAELAIAYRYGLPLVLVENCGGTLKFIKSLFSNFQEDYPLFIAKDAREAAEIALKIAKGKTL